MHLSVRKKAGRTGKRNGLARRPEEVRRVCASHEGGRLSVLIIQARGRQVEGGRSGEEEKREALVRLKTHHLGDAGSFD